MAERRPAWRRVAGRIKGRLSRARIYLRWLIHEVPHNPAHELYARRQAWKDRRANRAEKAAGAEAVRARLAPFRPSDMPRIVWMYWHQGAAEAPFVVRRCIESWQRRNPGWEIRVLDAETVAQYADISDIPAHLPFRFKANLLRLRLIRTHGGVWADATVWCHRPLDEWVWLHVTTGFFLLRNPGPGRWMSSWFMAGEAGHSLPVLWEEAYSRYVRRLRYVPDVYFVFFYLFQWHVRRDPQAQAAFDRMPSLPATPSLVMMEALRGIATEAELAGLVAAGLPVSKLTWKEILDEDGFDALCARIERTAPAALKE